jgi:hypothetical protein
MTPLAKPLQRKTVDRFMHYRKALVVELLPGDVIRLRLHGQRTGSAVSIRIADLYFELVDRKVRRDRAERLKARKQRRKERHMARK